MPEPLPRWLADVLEHSGAGHGRLLAARLGSAQVLGRDGFALTSAAFKNGAMLDPSFTADEEDSVAPPVEWTAPPAGAMELVLVVEDADAPGATPFCHWLVWGLAPQRGQILEGEAPPRVGKNAFGNSEWLLPDPPTGSAPHDYVFQLFAVDQPLALMPGASREDLAAVIEGHIVGLAVLSGRYVREEGGDYAWEDDDDDV